MRPVAVIVVLVALAAGAASMAGDAAASHNALPIIARSAAAPTWSPDGKQLAFASLGYASTDSGLYQTQFRIVRTSSKPGGRTRTVTRGGAQFVVTIAWTGGNLILSDGERLSFVSAHGGKTKRIVFPDCEAQPRCTVSLTALSPNHKFAAVTACDCGRDPDTIALLQLRPGKAPVATLEPLADTGEILAFSPDSTQLIYESSAGGLMALPVAGGDPVPVAQSGIPGIEVVPSDAEELQWSPDGRWLEYLEGDKLEAAPTNGDSPPRVLGTNVGVRIAWSPSSKTIAYTSAGSLMTVRPDGSHPMVVVHGHHHPFRYADVDRPQWSPDGSHLAFTTLGPTETTGHVWTVRPNGRNLTRRG